MNSTRPPQSQPAEQHAVGYRPMATTYLIGYLLSVGLTVLAYLLVQQHALTAGLLASGVAILAVAQFIVQLLFFLHLGRETKPRWNLLVFSFMLLIVGIIVGGSLWIMHNLNHRMTPQQMNSYMRSQDSL